MAPLHVVESRAIMHEQTTNEVRECNENVDTRRLVENYICVRTINTAAADVVVRAIAEG